MFNHWTDPKPGRSNETHVNAYDPQLNKQNNDNLYKKRITVVLDQSNGHEVFNVFEKEPEEHSQRNIKKHTCSSACPNETNTPPNSLNMFAFPMWYGWKRLYNINYDHSKVVFYLAPCGVKFYEMDEIFDWLQATGSRLHIDQFNLDSDFVVQESRSTFQVDPQMFLRDISKGREKVPISLINELDHDTLTRFEYITESEFPQNLELDKNFMVCCGCTNDCRDPEKCACQMLTRQAMRAVEGLEEACPTKNRQLKKKVISGIYECNKGCACRPQCVNRNVQLGSRNQLQVFKTFDRGWGVRTLHDIPKGEIEGDRRRVRSRGRSTQLPSPRKLAN